MILAGVENILFSKQAFFIYVVVLLILFIAIVVMYLINDKKHLEFEKTALTNHQDNMFDDVKEKITSENEKVIDGIVDYVNSEVIPNLGSGVSTSVPQTRKITTEDGEVVELIELEDKHERDDEHSRVAKVQGPVSHV